MVSWRPDIPFSGCLRSHPISFRDNFKAHNGSFSGLNILSPSTRRPRKSESCGRIIRWKTLEPEYWGSFVVKHADDGLAFFFVNPSDDFL